MIQSQMIFLSLPPPQKKMHVNDPAYYEEYYQTQLNQREWKYEMRRQMQEILPGLYIGPFQAAKDLQELKAQEITHILILKDVQESHLLREVFPGQFTYQSM
jgi:serine/threonine/tyrosine-interacting protein